MDAKKVADVARQIRKHQEAVRLKEASLIEGLRRIAPEGLNIELTPREKAQFKMAQSAELAAKEAKFTI